MNCPWNGNIDPKKKNPFRRGMRQGLPAGKKDELYRWHEYPPDDGKQRHWEWKRTWTCKEEGCTYTTRREGINGDVKCPHHGATMEVQPWKFKLKKASKRK